MQRILLINTIRNIISALYSIGMILSIVENITITKAFWVFVGGVIVVSVAPGGWGKSEQEK